MFQQFLREIIIRIGEKSPALFIYIRWVAGIISAITGILAFISTHVSFIHLHPILDFIGSYDASISSFLVVFVSLLPVEDSIALKEKLQK